MGITNNLKMHITKERITQNELAAELGVSAQQISNWVTGRTMPSLSLALHVAKRLNTTVDEIWQIDEE